MLGLVPVVDSRARANQRLDSGLQEHVLTLVSVARWRPLAARERLEFERLSAELARDVAERLQRHV